MAVVKLEQDENGELILPLTDPIFQDLGWEIGDVIEWIDNGDGSWSMVKQEKTKLVMVETVSSFRIRYVVEIPEDAPDEWALDTVACDDANEFSQEALTENIVSHRIIDQMEFLKQYRKDNSWCKSWDDDTCFKNGLTKWGPKDGE